MTPQRIAAHFAHHALRVVGFCSALALVCLASPARAQDGESTAQKPFVMILMDTSGSMEWTDQGDERYPENAAGESWSLDKRVDSQQFFGPCRVWDGVCGNYYRPTWNWSENGHWLRSAEQSAAESIRGNPSSAPENRLRNQSQPRHVTLKEILTGDMVLRRSGDSTPLSSLDPAIYGPGCWLVPRQRGTEVNGDICAGSSDFERYPDHTDPQPHFQEVFDGQHPNGLMDTMSRSAIFGLAMFDSYQHSKKRTSSTDSISRNWRGGNYGADDIDDTMTSQGFAGIYEGAGGALEDAARPASNYNLGVFQMLAPNSLDSVGADVAADISTFIQYALVDAGYLDRSGTHKLKFSKKVLLGLFDPVDNDNITFSKDLEDFLEEHQLGKQPIARATPLAAAIYDLHQFFAQGSPSINRNGASNGPVMDDIYRECRPKQVIMLTDGTPEPERPGGRAPLQNDSLNSAFGYNKAQYPYANTEDAIEYFVYDQQYAPSFNAATGDTTFSPSPRSGQSYLTGSWSAETGTDDYRKALHYNPRVHVVGLTGQNDPNADDADPAVVAAEERVIYKMAEMAISGLTCAGYYLGAEYIPTSQGGSCDPQTEFCLDERQAEYVSSTRALGSYEYLARDGSTPECLFPALVLAFPRNPLYHSQSSLVERIAAGLQLLFNHIVSDGLTSRTRPTFVNQLDDRSEPMGGQYRYFSGVNVGAGSPFWKGELFRQTHLCRDPDPTDGPQTTDFGAQVSDQAGYAIWEQDVQKEFDFGDRRIFTSFSAWNPNYYNTPPTPDTYPGTTSTRFSLGVDYAKLSANSPRDTFQDGYLRPQTTGIQGARIPVDHRDFEQIANEFSANDKTYYGYFHTESVAQLRYLIDEISGRTPQKQGRALGAILNASPIAVEPPDRALPIESYREFQSLFSTRPSMLYVATTDGFLHALYAGGLGDNASPDEADKVPSFDGTPVSKNMQREAWAYLPQMLHQKLAGFMGKHAYLLDGTPTVQDVRLCQPPTSEGAASYNLHPQACATSGLGTGTGYEGFLGAFQWRTVLVQGLGNAGAGYFALDITRAGGRAIQGDGTLALEAPDPIPLWEFDPVWEHYQVAKLAESGLSDVAYPSATHLVSSETKEACEAIDASSLDANFWHQSFMGNSVGEAAIGTVVLNATFGDAVGDTADRLRRPIAVFSGGSADQNPGACREHRMGRAIYVVDMQTGSLLRRFVSYEDRYDTGTEKLFEHPVTGSPALYDSRPGSLVTRGFVGDADGRMFRIDLSNPDPSKWYVELFFDPRQEIDGFDEHTLLGPAAFKPALSKGSTLLGNDLLVFYGLGEVGDLSVSNTKQLMIAVRERITPSLTGTDHRVTVSGEKVWHYAFQSRNPSTPSDSFSEKLTGAPVVFNSGVYFTTFVEPGADACAPGWSRIYGMKFEGDLSPTNSDVTSIEPEGLFRAYSATDLEPGQARVPQTTACYPSDGNCLAYQPDNIADLQEAIVVRGLTITQGQTCRPTPVDDEIGDPLDPGRSTSASSQQPTLMAQSTSSVFSGSDSVVGGGSASTGGGDGIFAIEQAIAKTTSGFNPLSWAVIDN